MLTVRVEDLRLKHGQRVLDVGCGRGRHMHGIAYAGARVGGVVVVGIDRNGEDLNAALEGLATLKTEGVGARGDALRLPFSDATFDVVVCSEVLEHLPDYQTALDEIARVVKPGGRVAVSVPHAWPEAICWRLAPAYAQEPGGHVRIFKAKDLRAAIEARGMSFTRRHFAHGLHSPYWWLKCAVWHRRDDHPLVRAYQRFLEWDILKQPRLTRWLGAIADPIMGKSVVLYFDAPQHTREGQR